MKALLTLAILFTTLVTTACNSDHVVVPNTAASKVDINRLGKYKLGNRGSHYSLSEFHRAFKDGPRENHTKPIECSIGGSKYKGFLSVSTDNGIVDFVRLDFADLPQQENQALGKLLAGKVKRDYDSKLVEPYSTSNQSGEFLFLKDKDSDGLTLMWTDKVCSLAVYSGSAMSETTNPGT
jgi:hypothetical protein